MSRSLNATAEQLILPESGHTSEFDVVPETGQIIDLTSHRVEKLLSDGTLKYSKAILNKLADFENKVMTYPNKDILLDFPNLTDSPVTDLIKFLENLNPSLDTQDRFELNLDTYFEFLDQIIFDLQTNKPEEVIRRLKKIRIYKRILDNISENEVSNLKEVVKIFYTKVKLVPYLQGGNDGLPLNISFVMVN